MPQPNFQNDSVSSLYAAGSVTGATGVAPIAGGASPLLKGVAAAGIGRTSAGLYTINTATGLGAEALAFKDGSIDMTPIGIAATDITMHIVSWTAAGLITVQANAGAVATDCDFTFKIWRIGANN